MTAQTPQIEAYLHVNRENPQLRGVSLHHDNSCANESTHTEPLVRLSDLEAYLALGKGSDMSAENLRQAFEQGIQQQATSGFGLASYSPLLDDMVMRNAAGKYISELTQSAWTGFCFALKILSNGQDANTTKASDK